MRDTTATCSTGMYPQIETFDICCDYFLDVRWNTNGDLLYSTADPALSEGEVHMVLGLFDTWNDALATGDSATVADLYAPHAVLLPTVSNDVRTDRAGIIDYFDKFLQIDPVGAWVPMPWKGNRAELLGQSSRK